MGRIIEILKEFQNNSKFVSLSYLMERFSLTSRTLQKDIQRINALLLEVSDCKIVKNKTQLIIIGNNSKKAIETLLAKFLKASSNSSKRDYQLLLHFIWETYPLSSAKLLEFTNSNLHSLNQKLILFNNFFQYYYLNLSLTFKTKKGWILVGCEKDLRFLATKILSNHRYFDSNLFDLYYKLDDLLLNNNFYNYYFHEIIYFLIVIIKRIRTNKLLNNYHSHFLLKYFFHKNNILEVHCQQLVNNLEKKFGLKFNMSELSFLKNSMLFNQRIFENDLFSDLKNFINDLIFKKYQLPLMIENFNWTLNRFLKENYLKLLFSFYKSYDFDEFNKRINNSLLFDDSYPYGWEILNIINFAFKKFYINVNFNLFVNDYLLASFNNLYLRNNSKNWKIPLYYQQVSNSFSEIYQIDKITWFIKSKYSNIILKSLGIDNNFYKFNFLNQSYSLLLHSRIAKKWSHFKRIFSIEYYHLISSQQFQENIDLAIKKLMLNKTCSSILIFDFFSKQKFYNLKSFLNFFQDFLIRKFKINWINFDLKNAFICQRFLQKNILLIHKIVATNNIELPIILIYLKDPLFFHKKNPIQFIFILITNSNTLYQYDWILSYLDSIKINFDVRINTLKKLYKILNNFDY